MSYFSFRMVIATLALTCCLHAVSFAQEAATEEKSAESKTADTKVEAKSSESKAEETATEKKAESKAEAKTTEQPEKKAEVAKPTEAKAEAEQHANEHKAADHKTESKSHGHDSATGHGSGDGHGDSHGHGLTAENTDLSHGNGTSQLNSPAEFRFDLAIATALVFLILLGILTKFAWGPISQALDQREHHIADMISTAEKNAHATELRMKELEAQLAAQAEAAREAINAARREGEIQKEKIIAQAQQAAEHEKNRALADIRDAKNLALREIAQKSVNTAVDLAKNIIRREVKAEDHKQLIQDSLAQFNQN